jgi:very-short-patch-repair endonuclease
MAAALACGAGALVSHRSAADLWDLLPTASTRIELAAPRGRKPRAGLVVHRTRVLRDEDRAEVDGIPVTSVARTIVDLADVVSPARLARALNQAELARLLDVAAIHRVLECMPGRRGGARLSRELARHEPDRAFTRSDGERRMLGLCRRHGLPRPHANAWVAGYEVDLYWPDADIVIEVDGGAVHRTSQAFHEDRRRDRALAAVGIQVCRVTDEDLADEAALARELRVIRACRLRGDRARR